MRILVTGGTGFIGTHLVAALATAGNEIVVLDNLHRSHVPPVRLPGVHFIEGDLRDRKMVYAASRGVRVIYHLGAQSNVMEAVANVDYSFTTNVIGTYQVLAAALEERVERVVFTSSREVYGEAHDMPVVEECALNPQNAYGASKASAEVYCRAFQRTYGLDISVLRLANVYGPGDYGRVIPLWLERARQRTDLELYGGEQVLDFVPVGTVVAALQRAAATSLGGQPVNVASGVGTRLRDLAARMQALPGFTARVRRLPARSVEVRSFIADVTRMRTLLGIEPPSAGPLAELPELWDGMRDAPLAVSSGLQLSRQIESVL